MYCLMRSMSRKQKFKLTPRKHTEDYHDTRGTPVEHLDGASFRSTWNNKPYVSSSLYYKPCTSAYPFISPYYYCNANAEIAKKEMPVNPSPPKPQSNTNTGFDDNSNDSKEVRDHSNFTLNKKEIKLLKNSLKRCGDMIDMQGWRYSKEIGIDEYQPIDVEDKEVQYQFSACVNFLRKNFPRAFNRDTVSSMDLREACELWWYDTQDEKLYIDNGIMLLAVVARNLCSSDLWYSMEHNQHARIPTNKWMDFCEKYDYQTKHPWSLSDEDTHIDILKIN